MCSLNYNYKKKLNNILLSLFVFLGYVNCVNATTIKTIECEFSEQYKNWLKLPIEERKKTEQPIKCKTESNFFTSLGNDIAETYESERFDLRDYSYVTPMEDQGDSNLCWTFASLESIESNLLMNEIGEYDFSEAHIGFSAQNQTFEGLMPVNREFNGGANYFISSAYFNNRLGPILESDLPFSYVNDAISNNVFPTTSDLAGKKAQFAVNSTTFLLSNQGMCSNDTIESAKKYLVAHGALAANMFFNFGTNITFNNNYAISSNTTNGAYYFYDGSSWTGVPTNAGVNHAVTIVGWDDKIDASNFSTTPTRDGAWIVKNSYGTHLALNESISVPMGNDGYYYISYDDVNICTTLAGFYDLSDIDDNSYIHDTIGVNDALGARADIYLANVFEKKSSDNNVEQLTKVTFFSGMINQQYDILLSTDGDLSNATVIKSGITDHVGYVTVNIDDVVLTNDNFGIAVKYYYDGLNLTPLYLYSDFDSSFFYMDVTEGLSYISTDGTTWGNFSYDNKNLLASIKAYTNNLDYSINQNSTYVENNKQIISYNYKHIYDTNNITYDIYEESDTSYSTSLKDKFTIINDISNSKKIFIELNNNSEQGNYVMVVKYKEATIATNFSVSLNSQNTLFFGKNIVTNNNAEDDNNTIDEGNNSINYNDANPNNGDVILEVNDNPLNDDVNDIENEYIELINDQIKENPKTDGLDMIPLIIVMIISLLIAANINKYNNNSV